MGALLYGAYELRQLSRTRAANEARGTGMAAYERSDYETALAHLSRYASRFKSDAEVWLAMADSRRRVVMANRAHLIQAAALAQLAAELRPDDTPTLELLIEVYGEMGQYTEQYESAERLLALAPDHLGALQAAIASQAVMGNREAAVAAAHRLVQSYPHAIEGHAFLVSDLLAREPSPQPAQAYADDLADRLNSIESVLLAASVWEQTARTDNEHRRARDLAQYAAEMPIHDSAMLRRVVRILDRMGMRDAAARVVERSIAAGGADVAVIAAERGWRAGNPETALALLNPTATSLADVPEAWLGWVIYLGADRLASDRVSSARAELLSRRTPAAASWIQFFGALDAQRSGNYKHAMQEYRAATPASHDLAPGLSELSQYEFGQCEIAVGEGRQAIDRYLFLAEREPYWLNLHLELVGLLISHGRFEQAVQRATRCIANHPTSFAAALALADAYAAMVDAGVASRADTHAAVALLEQIYQQGVDRGVDRQLLVESDARLARLLLEIGEPARAEPVLARLIEAEAAPSRALLIPLVERVSSAGLTEYTRLIDMIDGEESESPQSTYWIAARLASAGRVEEGRSLIQRGIENASEQDRFEIQRLMVRYLAGIGLTDEAVQEAAVLARYYPDRSQAQHDLLDIEAAWNNEATVGAAIDNLRRTTGDDGASWRMYEARRLLHFDRSSARAAQAVELLSSIVRTGSENVSALVLTAEGLSQLGDAQGAIEMLGRAVDAGGARPIVHTRLIELLDSQLRVEEAQRRLIDFTKLRALSPDELRSRARLLASYAMHEAALRDMRSAYERDPGASLPGLAIALAKSGNLEEAEPQLVRIAEDQQRPAELRSAAVLQLAQGWPRERTEGFIASLNDLSEEHQSALVASALFAASPAALDVDLAGALAAYDPTPPDEQHIASLHAQLTRNPRDLECRRDLVAAFLMSGRLDEALGLARDGARLLPASPLAAQLASETIRRAGSIEEAITMANEWRRRTLDAPMLAEIVLASLESDRARSADALRWIAPWEDRIRVNASAYPDYAALLARIWINNQRERDAHAMLRPLAESDPAWTTVYIAMGRWLVMDGDRFESWFESSRSLAADDTAARLLLAEVCMQRAMLTGSADMYRRIIGLIGELSSSDEDVVAHALLLGAAHQSLDEYADAERMYREVLNRAPDDAIAMNNLAGVLIQQGAPGDEPLSLARRAVELSSRVHRGGPVHISCLDTLGRAQIHAAQPGEARVTYEQALRLDRSSDDLQVGLIEAVAALGDYGHATRLLRQYDAVRTDSSRLSSDLARRIELLRTTLAPPEPETAPR